MIWAQEQGRFFLGGGGGGAPPWGNSVLLSTLPGTSALQKILERLLENLQHPINFGSLT